MEKIQIKDLNVNNMLAFLNNADIEMMQIIEFKKESISSKGHPANKMFVKYACANVSDVLQYTFPEKYSLLKFPVYKLSKFISTLNVYKAAGYEKLIGTIEYKVIGDELLGERIILNTEKNEMKTTIQRTDLAAIGYLSDEVWEKISDVKDYNIKFDINKDFVQRIKSLMGISYGDGNNEKKDEHFIMNVQGKTITFENNKQSWNCVLPDNNIDVKATGLLKFDLPSRLLEWMTSPMQTVYITTNSQQDKHNFIIHENAMSISINLVTTHNPNIYNQ